MFIINFCLNMFRASLCPSSEQRPYYCIWCVVLVLLDVVGSVTATNHIQQYQNNTPNAVTRPLFS